MFLKQKLKKSGQFRMQELWLIETLALHAIVSDVEAINKTDDIRLKRVIRSEIEDLKLLIKKCYWQQGKEADNSWDKYLSDIKSNNNKEGLI